MNVDLTKLMYGNLYEIPIKAEITMPKERLNGTDIKEISPVKVNGYVSYDGEEYCLNINVTGTMTLSCARTLKDVLYPFNIDIDEVIGENNDNSLEIIQNRLDIFPTSW